MPREAPPSGAVGLRVEVAEADRDRLRVAAAKAGKSMAAYARWLIMRHLDEIDEVEGRGNVARKAKKKK